MRIRIEGLKEKTKNEKLIKVLNDIEDLIKERYNLTILESMNLEDKISVLYIISEDKNNGK